MTRLRQRRIVVPAAAGLVLILAVLLWVRFGGAGLRIHDSAFVLVALAFMTLGEMLRVHSNDRYLAPVSTATGMGLVLAPVGLEHAGLTLAEAMICVGGAAAVAVITRLLAGLPVDLLDMVARYTGISVTAIVARIDVGHGDILQWWREPDRPAWLGAIVLSLVALLGVAVELGVWTATRSRTWRIPILVLLREDIARSGAIGALMTTAGALIAIGTPAVGALAIPLFLWPIALALVGLRRAQRIAAMDRQIIEALARLTDETGHTARGHARRVSRLAVAMGEDLGLGPAELNVVREAALLHDVGQVTLHQPIPEGATLLAAPAEQAWVARESGAIAERAGSAPEVVEAIRGSQLQFRQVRELGEPIPVAGRIVKVANAYDDLTRGRRSGRGQALERIHLGLGYEYDPSVVDALTRVTEVSRHRSRD